MGGIVSRSIVKKVVRPIKNLDVDNRAQKFVDRHKVAPVAAPLHPSTKEMIQKHVADHPEIKEDLEWQDQTLVNRVHRLQVEMIDDMPKIKSTNRPLPQSRAAILDPHLAVEEPKKIPKGKLSLRQLGTILDKHNLGPTLYQAEIVAKEYTLELQPTIELLKYFEKIKIEDIVDEEKLTKDADKKMKWELNFNYGEKKAKPH